MNLKKLSIMGAIALGLMAGCKGKDDRVACDGSTPTWNSKVLDIVATSCWGSTCHGAGANNGDYTTYALIQPVLLDGRFETEVLESRRMPRNETFPDSTLAVLQCWLENGFPEN